MVVFLDDTNDIVRLWPTEDDHVRRVDGHHLDLVPRECLLKLFDLRYTTWSFRNTGQSIQFLGSSFLEGISLLEIMIIAVPGITIGISQ